MEDKRSKVRGGGYMAEEKDIDTLYRKINKLDSRMTGIEATRPFLKEMIERNIKSNEKLASTLQEVQMSMVNLNHEMKEQSEAMISMKKEFSDVKAKVESIEEKGKFDIHSFIKSNWPWIMILLGIGFYSISKFVKF